MPEPAFAKTPEGFVVVTKLISNAFDVLREDWRTAVWSSLVTLAGAFVSMIVSGIVFGGGFWYGFATLEEGVVPTIGQMSVLALFAFVLVLLTSLIGMAAGAYARGGVISVLRVRSAGMRTSFKTFLEHARAAFSRVWRPYKAVWIVWMIAAFLVIVGLLLGYAAVNGASDIEEAIAGIGVFMILLFFPIWLVMMVGNVVLALAVRYGAFAAFDDASLTGWQALGEGMRFLRARIWPVLGMGTLFFVIGMALSTVMQIVMIPFQLLAVIPVIGVAFMLLGFVVVMAVAMFGQSAVWLWEDEASIRLYDERKGA